MLQIGVVWLLALLLSQPARATETWLGPGALLHRMNKGGTLALELPLWDYQNENGLRISFTLRHSVVLSADGYPESQFDVPQLRSYVTPAGRNVWLWRKPGGQPVAFVFKDGMSSARNMGRTMNLGGPGAFTVITDAGMVYEYEHYGLRRLVCRSGLTFVMSTQGGRIYRIEEITDGQTKELVSATYVNDRLSRISFEGARRYVMTYTDSGPVQLSRVTRDDGADVYKMIYEKAMLVSVADDKAHRVGVRWAEFADFRRGDHSFRQSVWLQSDDRYTYNYRIEDIWVIMSAEAPDGKREELTYNLLNQKIARSKSETGYDNRDSLDAEPDSSK